MLRVAGVGTLWNANNTVIDALSDETDGINDFEYYGPLRFGSQAQTLQIDFDTGSAGGTSLLFGKRLHQLVCHRPLGSRQLR